MTATAQDDAATAARTLRLARHASTILLVAAGLGLVAWGWQLLRIQGLVGEGWGSMDRAFGLWDRLDLAASSLSQLLWAVLTGGVGTGIRLYTDHWTVLQGDDA